MTTAEVLDYITSRVQAELAVVESYQADLEHDDYTAEWHLAGLMRTYHQVLSILHDAERSANVVSSS